jgi:23S rRNA pseudouridine1911/1915/1917 synthase
MQRIDEFIIPENVGPDRADRVLAEHMPGEQTRSALARLMRRGLVRVGGTAVRPSTVLNPGDRIEFLVEGSTATEEAEKTQLPEFSIITEDEDVIVVDKPPGLVVHPGAGRPSATLMDALIEARPQMIGVGEPGRWGVVHRLDRDTSGVMVLVKTQRAHASLSAQFKEHSVHRIYLALVRADPGEDQGVVDAPLGRHAKDRKKISTRTGKPRRAVTRWRVLQRLGGITLLEITPETGRTHQIRVHLASVGLPIAGDQVYGKLRKKATGLNPVQQKAVAVLKRQALHAAVLGFIHPATSQYVEFSSQLPEDMTRVIEVCGG